MTDNTTRESIGLALAAIPSGCSILTCQTETESTGMLASWVQQAAFEPPMVSVAVKTGRPIEALLEASQRFVLNAVGADPTALFKHFGKGFEPGEPAFEGLTIQASPHGVILGDAAAWLACEIRGALEAGDHRVYLGEVVAGVSTSETKPYVHLRKSGFSY